MYKNIYTRHKGFISAATMILMMTSLGIVMTMLYRSNQGNLLAGRLKQSNQVYQSGDNAIEVLLQHIKQVDEGTYNPGTALDSSKKIPENILVTDFCSTASCYDATNTLLTTSTAPTAKLADVSLISDAVGQASAARAIQAAVPPRIATPTITPTAALSGVDIAVSWPDINTSIGADQIEVRRAFFASGMSVPANPLNDPSVTWERVGGGLLAITAMGVTDPNPAPGQYVYALKVTNAKPLELDSLYTAPSPTVTK